MARLRARSDAPITKGLLIINALIWLGQISPLGYAVTNAMFFSPILAAFEPWRMLTAGFVHDWNAPWHILLNSFAIYIFGRELEPMLGKFRFLFLYLASILGGSVVVLWLSELRTPVVGASGAFFGLMGAFFIIERSLGKNPTQLLVLIVINLSMGFFVSGISWEGHLGGLVTGAAIAAIYMESKKRPKPGAYQLGGCLVMLAILVGLTLAKVLSWF